MKRTRAVVLTILSTVLIGAGLLAAPAAVAETGTTTATATDLAFPDASCRTTTVSITGMPNPHFYVAALFDSAGMLAANVPLPNYNDPSASVAVSVCPTYLAPGPLSIRVLDAPANAWTTVGTVQLTFPTISVGRYKGITVGTLAFNGQPIARAGLEVQVMAQGSWQHVRNYTTTKNGTLGLICLRGKKCSRYFRFAFQGYAYSTPFHVKHKKGKHRSAERVSAP